MKGTGLLHHVFLHEVKYHQRAKGTWIETSENMSQIELFFVFVDYLRYFVIASES
jgi:hypothetical protein